MENDLQLRGSYESSPPCRGYCTCVGEELGRSLVKPCHSAFLALSQKCGKRVKIACPMRQYLCHRQHTLESPIRTAVWTHFWVRGQKLNTKSGKRTIRVYLFPTGFYRFWDSRLELPWGRAAALAWCASPPRAHFPVFLSCICCRG